MTQNIYDNDTFLAGYSQLPRSVGGLDAAPEWPALRAMLPEFKARRHAGIFHRTPDLHGAAPT